MLVFNGDFLNYSVAYVLAKEKILYNHDIN